jgi:predicted dehydrogenase
VIGLGDISTLHLAAIQGLPGAELVAVCDVDPGRAAAAAERLGVAAFTDIATLFAEARPDVVHICTLHSEHAAAAIAALDAGIRHVILEKPVARDPQQAAAVVAAAQRSTAKIAVCFQNRYNTPSPRPSGCSTRARSVRSRVRPAR